MRRVYVTGMGAVSPVGIGVDAFWSALQSGQSGAAPIESFDTSDLSRQIGCEVKHFRARDHLNAAECRRMGRCAAMTLTAAKEAVAASGVALDLLSGSAAAVFVGTTMGEANVLGQLESSWIHAGEETIQPAQIARYGTTLLPIHVARSFGMRGSVQTIPAACAAGNYAIGFAADHIRNGRAEMALAGAAEVIEKLQYAGFCRLGAVATERCQPYDLNREGLLVGEGAGMLLLESEESVQARGATVLAEVGGYGLACDAHHITRPHPDGKGSEVAMREALRASGIAPRDVDFINGHGTATQANDAVEAMVTNRIFGTRGIPITSNKSMIGHCMGASSALEAISCVMSLQEGIIPPTINYETADPDCDLDVVTTARKSEPKIVLNNALAFGGYDAALVLASEGVLPSKEERNGQAR